MDKSPEAAPLSFQVKDVKLLKDGQIKVNKAELEQLKSLEKD